MVFEIVLLDISSSLTLVLRGSSFVWNRIFPRLNAVQILFSFNALQLLRIDVSGFQRVLDAFGANIVSRVSPFVNQLPNFKDASFRIGLPLFSKIDSHPEAFELLISIQSLVYEILLQFFEQLLCRNTLRDPFVRLLILDFKSLVGFSFTVFALNQGVDFA